MTISAYYDGFRERLVGDYLVGNRRVLAALDFACDALAGTGTLLDVGCGIGWTSVEMADSGKQVTGIDISPVLVDTARAMFGDRCRFVHGDFAFAGVGRFDAVLMVDVYEHFPRDLRPVIHERLVAIDPSRIVLTVPTPEALQSARELGIELQPVDEDVTDEDVERIAWDVNGTVVVNRVVSIWAENDYRHVLIERT